VTDFHVHTDAHKARRAMAAPDAISMCKIIMGVTK
jgi:hypothetical protein